VKRLVPIAVLLGLFALATGTLEHLHNLQHQREDAAAAKQDPNTGYPAGQNPVHNDSNCLIHFQLHLPICSAGWVPLLVFLGLFVSFLTLLTPRLAPQGVTIHIACRGPPVL
jgi:hypothetical protein